MSRAVAPTRAWLTNSRKHGPSPPRSTPNFDSCQRQKEKKKLVRTRFSGTAVGPLKIGGAVRCGADKRQVKHRRPGPAYGWWSSDLNKTSERPLAQLVGDRRKTWPRDSTRSISNIEIFFSVAFIAFFCLFSRKDEK